MRKPAPPAAAALPESVVSGTIGQVQVELLRTGTVLRIAVPVEETDTTPQA